MHMLAYWRIDNYRRDLDEGAGFNYNSRQPRLHTEIELGESLWLFTVLKNPARFYLAARLVIRAKTINPPEYKYGGYRVWGDLNRSRYFRIRPDVPSDEAFRVLQRLPLVSGSLGSCSQSTLPQACQTIRGIAAEGISLLEQFTAPIPTEERAIQVADEYELERCLVEGDDLYAEVLERDHTGPSEGRRQHLLGLSSRNRQLVKDLNDRYCGRCQLCAFDSTVVYGVPSAEAHHIVYLSRGGEDNPMNMVLLCPNHHTIIHKTDAPFDYSRLMFCFPNGRTEPLCLNTHLNARPFMDVDPPAPRAVPPSSRTPDLKSMCEVVVSQLTPDLLSAEWAALRREGDHPLKGYCYVASEAIYHLAGGGRSGLSVRRCSLPTGGTHWWLVDSNGQIVDPTAEQFATLPPYSAGIGTAFLSQQPSRRALRLIAKVQSHLAEP
jgi:hypothetical protein